MTNLESLFDFGVYYRLTNRATNNVIAVSAGSLIVYGGPNRAEDQLFSFIKDGSSYRTVNFYGAAIVGYSDHLFAHLPVASRDQLWQITMAPGDASFLTFESVLYPGKYMADLNPAKANGSLGYTNSPDSQNAQWKLEMMD